VKPILKKHKVAKKGDFIKDISFRQRSMGYVLGVDKTTDMMKVFFPITGRKQWVVLSNYGHYMVI
jgi:hypothetical protein